MKNDTNMPVEPESHLNPELLQSEESDKRLPIAVAIEKLYHQFKGCNEGKIADYIPELAKADRSKFCISLVTINGEIHTIGDEDEMFTMQSISKPFVYGLILEAHSREEVLARIGVEPTGDSFDSIIKLDSTNKPHNPMVNAGAIVAADMVPGATYEERLKSIYEAFEKYVGRPPEIDMSVFHSEHESGNRNKALAYLLLNFKRISNRVDDTLELYFRQCSIKVSTTDLAVMAVTMVNQGINPLTKVQALRPEHVRDVLSIMLTCGMYDYSGEWAFNVGMPAKSGVSGGIMMAIPGVGGIGIYSPLLDSYGNSVRGIHVCRELSRQIGLHLLDASFASLGERAFGAVR